MNYFFFTKPSHEMNRQSNIGVNSFLPFEIYNCPLKNQLRSEKMINFRDSYTISTGGYFMVDENDIWRRDKYISVETVIEMLVKFN